MQPTQPVPESQPNPPTNPPADPGVNPADLIAAASQEDAAPQTAQQTYFPQATPDGVSPPVDPVVPTAPTSTTMSQHKQEARKGKRWKIVVVILLLLLLTSGAGAAAYYTFIYQPKMALVQYFTKLASSKTGELSATIAPEEVKPADTTANLMGISASMSLKLEGVYDFRDAQNTKLDAKLTLSGQEASQNTEIEAILSDKNAYLRVNQLGLLAILGIPIDKAWYKLALDQTFAQSDCVLKGGNSGNNFLGLKAFSNLPIKNAKRHGVKEQVDGVSMTHYSGDIDFTKLKDALDKTNAQLSASCKIKLDTDGYKNTTASYDFYTSKDSDKIVITYAKGDTKASATIVSKAYNSDVKVTVPPDAKDIKTILQELGASFGLTQTTQ